MYIGYTTNVNRRLEEHHRGKSFATAFRRPFEVMYIEGCTNQEDALRREKYMKTTYGRRFLAKRLKTRLAEVINN